MATFAACITCTIFPPATPGYRDVQCARSLAPCFSNLKVRFPASTMEAHMPRRKAIAQAGEEEVTVAGKDDDVDVYPSGDWPANFSMSNYEDLSLHYAASLFKDEGKPALLLLDAMTQEVWTAFPDTLVSEVEHHFRTISGVPVVNSDLQCVGVLSRKDMEKTHAAPGTKVKDVMTSPAVTVLVDRTVQDAAVLMLKEKVHRIPVVNDAGQVVGIVTRSDIFTALEGLPKTSSSR